MNDIAIIAQFDRLWQEICDLSPISQRDPSGWERLPSPGALPSPWLTWTLIALLRHRQRQLWVGQIVRERLDGDLDLIASGGALAHPEARPQRGPVPGLPEWEYYFHGCGCCLTHRVRGEEIDVDFFGDHAECFDVFFFINYLRSLREPELPERRLIDLHPSFESVRLAYDTLEQLGFLNRSEARAPRLSESTLTHEDRIDAFCESWVFRDKGWDLAARVGDWPLALAKLPDDADPELRRLVVARSEAVVADRIATMKGIFEAGEETRLALLGLSDANASDLAATITLALRGPVSGTTSSALSLINQQANPNHWCEEVYTLFRRLDPYAQLPQPYLWCESIRFLLRNGYRTKEIAAALPNVGSHMVGEAAMLAIEHAPQHAIELFRRALRSSIPVNRMTAAATLALIDQPWSRQELVAILRESDEQEPTSECRAAMAESRDPLIRQAVLDWEERNPHEREIGKFITMNEMHLRQAPSWLLYEMDKLRERVLAVSTFEPPKK